MTTPVSVSQFTRKSYESPDERRTPPNAQVDVVQLEGFTLGRLTFQPGWRWSESIKPVAGTDSCQVSHVGYVVSGTATIQLADGTEERLTAGESYTIPPGHDAWVDGSEPFICLEVLSANEFAKG